MSLIVLPHRLILFFLGFIAGFCWFSPPNHAAQSPVMFSEQLEKKTQAVVPLKRFHEADQAFAKRLDPGEAKKALDLYRKAAHSNPKDVEAAWRQSMACYFMGIRHTSEEDAKKTLHQEGIDAGQKAIALDKNCAPCHFWTAINIALFGEAKGVFSTLFRLDEVQEHAQKSAALNPSYAWAGAYRLLGVVDQKVPSLLGGDDERSKKYFEKALKLAPNEPLNYLFMAQLLEEEFDEPRQALEYAEKGLKLPLPSSDRVESREAMEDLEKLVKRLKEDVKG